LIELTDQIIRVAKSISKYQTGLGNSEAVRTAQTTLQEASIALGTHPIPYATFPDLVKRLGQSRDGIVTSYKAWWQRRLDDLTLQIQTAECTENFRPDIVTNIRTDFLDKITTPESFVASAGASVSNAQHVEQQVEGLTARINREIATAANEKLRTYQADLVQIRANRESFGGVLRSEITTIVLRLIKEVELLLSDFNKCKDTNLEDKLGYLQYYLQVILKVIEIIFTFLHL
jgi:hypothetical protein